MLSTRGRIHLASRGTVESRSFYLCIRSNPNGIRRLGIPRKVEVYRACSERTACSGDREIVQDTTNGSIVLSICRPLMIISDLSFTCPVLFAKSMTKDICNCSFDTLEYLLFLPQHVCLNIQVHSITFHPKSRVQMHKSEFQWHVQYNFSYCIGFDWGQIPTSPAKLLSHNA